MLTNNLHISFHFRNFLLAIDEYLSCETDVVHFLTHTRAYYDCFITPGNVDRCKFSTDGSINGAISKVIMNYYMVQSCAGDNLFHDVIVQFFVYSTTAYKIIV